MTVIKRVSFTFSAVAAILCLFIGRHTGGDIMGEEQRRLVGELCNRAIENRNRTTPVRVAVFDAQVPGLSDRTAGVTACLPADKFICEAVGPIEIAEGALARFDVVVLPGGNARNQAGQLRENGRKAILRFVRDGQGYVGICAGAYMAGGQVEWSLGLIDGVAAKAEVHGKRAGPAPSVGSGAVNIQLTDGGRRVFPFELDVMSIECAGGPIFLHDAWRDKPGFVPLATFLTSTYNCQVNNHSMIGVSAIIAARYGKGHVIVFSPHPESLDETRSLLVQAICATARVSP